MLAAGKEHEECYGEREAREGDHVGDGEDLGGGVAGGAHRDVRPTGALALGGIGVGDALDLRLDVIGSL